MRLYLTGALVLGVVPALEHRVPKLIEPEIVTVALGQLPAPVPQLLCVLGLEQVLVVRGNAFGEGQPDVAVVHRSVQLEELGCRTRRVERQRTRPELLVLAVQVDRVEIVRMRGAVGPRDGEILEDLGVI